MECMSVMLRAVNGSQYVDSACENAPPLAEAVRFIDDEARQAARAVQRGKKRVDCGGLRDALRGHIQ